MSIKSFKCSDSENLFNGARVKHFANIEAVAMRKLAMLNRAGKLDDLRVPPGNKLEALKGKPLAGIVSASMTSIVCASAGQLKVLKT